MVVEVLREKFERFSRLLKNGRITVDEFCSNTLLWLVQVDEDSWRVALSTLDANLLEHLSTYCADEINEDFVAPVEVFMPHGCSESEVSQKRDELTQQYHAVAKYISSLGQTRQ